MSRFTRVAAGALAAGSATLVAVALTLPADASAAPSPKLGVAHACARTASVGHATCFALVRTANGKAMATPSVTKFSGYAPSALETAYNIKGLTSGAKTVAIVDAYNNPNAESDLAVYRSTYHLPACTTANGCFKKVNQSGGSSLPGNNQGWGLEISLDVDMVSAACPDCHILLVEASSTSFDDLGTAVNYAATQNVAAISNSYGAGEFSGENTYAGYYDHPGIAVTVSTGDGGYATAVPAAYKTVVAVGGTTLKRASSTARGWKETAWSGAGSGCSSQVTRPSWQPANITRCSKRAMADVSADADPSTGPAVYDTFGYGGFLPVGGTSASAPFIAGVYALGGNLTGYPASYTWTHAPDDLYDVVGGNNGSCTPAKWCHAVAGWDGPTGLGTPNGVGAF